MQAEQLGNAMGTHLGLGVVPGQVSFLSAFRRYGHLGASQIATACRAVLATR